MCIFHFFCLIYQLKYWKQRENKLKKTATTIEMIQCCLKRRSDIAANLQGRHCEHSVMALILEWRKNEDEKIN